MLIYGVSHVTSQVKHVTSVSSVTLNSCQERPERPWHPPYFSPQPPPPPHPPFNSGSGCGGERWYWKNWISMRGSYNQWARLNKAHGHWHGSNFQNSKIYVVSTFARTSCKRESIRPISVIWIIIVFVISFLNVCVFSSFGLRSN